MSSTLSPARAVRAAPVPAFLRRAWPVLLLVVLALPALWPYTHGFPFTADGPLHLLRTGLLDAHLQRGQFYPRWVPELVLGYGYPVFNFYGPAGYYLAEALHLLGLGFYQALMAAFAVLLLVAGLGMYRLARDYYAPAAGPWPALAAGLAYHYAPYLLTNVFVRAAIGEVAAQALLPWIFWSFRRLLRHPTPAAWLLPASLSLALLALSHNITLILLPPALLAYLLVVWWQAGRSPARLAWAVAGGVAAVGLSAFFWWPLLAERQFLAATAYDNARRFLPENVWTWRNFLDGSFVFDLTFAIPFQLGLVQLTLAVGGFLLARKRDAEALYWLALALVACLGIGAWALPLWLGSEVLLVAQFPWRLLSLASVPLALFTGGLLLHRPFAPRWRVAAGLVVLALIVAGNHPRLPEPSLPATDNDALGAAALAQFEFESGSLGTSSANEFFPRWVAGMRLDAASAALTAPPGLEVTLHSASPYERRLTVTAPAGTPLRFADFYFPGWEATLDDQPGPPAYASTSLGLLTVDVPVGTHTLRLRWHDTPARAWATRLSLLTAAALTLWALTRLRPRWLAAVPALLLLVGALAAFKPLPAPAAVQPPRQPFEQDGLSLLGYRAEQVRAGFVELYPYWQAGQSVPRLVAHWQLRSPGGSLLTEAATEPYFGATQTSLWPAATVVDDAYQLALPPGLAAGDYELWLQLRPPGAASSPSAFTRVGTVSLSAVPARATIQPRAAVDVHFADRIRLAGYDLRHNGRAVADPAATVPVARDDVLAYTLYWQGLAPVEVNYHGFIHLRDAGQGVLVKRDHLAGSWLRAPRLWDAFHLQPDHYRVEIPSDAPGGVYWPHVGLYDFQDIRGLPVTTPDGAPLGDTFTLPAVKVVPPPPSAPPQHEVAARFEDLAELRGYDLALPPAGLRAGDTLTLTLYYRSLAPTAAAFTRFVHLVGPSGEVAAQADSPPQNGLNPTWAWVPGEVIADPVSMTLAPNAAPGEYQLLMGLYDAEAGGLRLTVFDRDGQPRPDGTWLLQSLTVAP